MLELLGGIGKAHHPVRLNHSIRSDLVWWDVFLESLNGVSFLRPAERRTPDHHLFLDAAGSFRCGGCGMEIGSNTDGPRHLARRKSISSNSYQ